MLITWHNSMQSSILSTWNLSDGKKSSQSCVLIEISKKEKSIAKLEKATC